MPRAPADFCGAWGGEGDSPGGAGVQGNVCYRFIERRGSVGREALPAVVLWAGHVPSLSGPWREVASLCLWVSHLRGHFWQINPLDGTCIDDHALRCLLGQVCGVGFRAEPRQVRAWGWTGKRNQGSSGAWSSPPGLALSLPRLLPLLSLCQNVRRGGVFGALLALPPPPFHLYLWTALMEDYITFQATWLAQHAEVGCSKGTCPLFGHTDPDQMLPSRSRRFPSWQGWSGPWGTGPSRHLCSYWWGV